MQKVIYLLILSAFAFTSNLQAQIFTDFEQTANSNQSINFTPPESCQGFPTAMCGTYQDPSGNATWTFLDLSIPGLDFTLISVDEATNTFCIEILESNFTNLDCITFTAEITLISSANSTSLVTSSVVFICLNDIVCECVKVEISDLLCFNNGSQDTDDDFWTFMMTVTDPTGTGSKWITDPYIGEGFFDVPTLILPGTILQVPSVTFYVFDISKPDCKVEITVEAPELCSPSCELQLIAKPGECDNSGTEDIQSDDKFSVEVAIIGNENDPWELYQDFDDGSPAILVAEGSGNENVLMNDQLIQDGNFILRASLLNNPDCILETLVVAPEFCSGCQGVLVSNIQCYDKGTPDASDDYWTFDILVTGGVDAMYKISETYGIIGEYGQIYTINVGTIVDCIDFTIQDLTDSTCFTNIVLCPPPTCSSGFCQLQAQLFTIECTKIDIGGGNFEEGIDLSLYVGGTEDQCWTVTKENIDGSTELLGEYVGDQKLTLGTFPEIIDFNLVFQLCDNPDCRYELFIDAPDCEDLQDQDVDLRSREGRSFTAFPNPIANELINFEITDDSKGLIIYDARGQVVYSNNLLEGRFQLELDIAPGLYFAQHTDINGKLQSIKLVKQ